MATTNPLGIDLDHYKWGFRDPEKYVFKARKGLDREIVEEISHMKGEPDWMRAIRLHSLEHFQNRPTPKWGANLDQIDFNDIYYYLKPTEGKGHTWDDVPADIKRTFDRLGIPEAEKKFLAGVGAQYESESVYHNLKEEWEKLGVIFLDTDSALKQHPDIVQEYFGTVVPPEDNKLAALNTAVWSGGSFVYVPAGVKVDIPLQAYFRINAEKAGQFERTMIICEPGSYVHYVEGCTAPIYTTDSLHSAVVEIIVKEGARCRYTTIQNWSTNTYNLVTKRAVAYRDATMEWVDGNLGCLTGDSKVLLNNDVKPISQVSPGDTVYSVDGELNLTRHKVVAKKYSGKQQVLRLRAVSHGEIRATANHPFLTLSKRGQNLSIGWKRLDELTTDDSVAIAGNVSKTAARALEPVHAGVVGRTALETVSTEQLTRIVGIGSVEFVQVESIEPQGVEDTWDLEIAGSHNFVADGFVVHNSKITMKYPSVYMVEPGAKAEILSVAFAGKGQHQDPGGKVVHAAPNTQSSVVSKSIAKDGGRAGYRGLVKVYPGAKGSKCAVRCDALILDDKSRSDTYPYMEIDEQDISITHEATVSKVSDEQLFYLMSRGIKADEAMNMIVRGFIEPIVKELPLEYAVELNRLIALEMEGSVG